MQKRIVVSLLLVVTFFALVESLPVRSDSAVRLSTDAVISNHLSTVSSIYVAGVGAVKLESAADEVNVKRSTRMFIWRAYVPGRPLPIVVSATIKNYGGVGAKRAILFASAPHVKSMSVATTAYKMAGDGFGWAEGSDMVMVASSVYVDSTTVSRQLLLDQLDRLLIVSIALESLPSFQLERLVQPR